MIVISNSSPLLALSQIQRLDILKTLFGPIYNYWGQSKINSKSERRMGEL
jgi:predicted nucleic acid-binding protein